MKSISKKFRVVSRPSPATAGWQMLLLGGTAALMTGCAQFQKSVTQPNPLSQGFAHPLLADRNPYYPTLTPVPVTDAAPTVEAGYGELPSSPGARPLRAGEAASRTARPVRSLDIADAGRDRDLASAGSVDGARDAGTARIDEVSGLGFTGQAADSAQGDGGVSIDLAPERPRAPKATTDRGLGDPGAGDAVTEPALERDTAETVPDFDPAFVAPDFEVDERAAQSSGAAPARQPDSATSVKNEERRQDVPTRETRPRPAAPRAAAPAAVSSSPTAGLGDGTVSGEVLAAAQRLVGVRTPFDEARFLAHLLSAADLALASGDSGETYIRSVREQLAAQGRVFGASVSPRPGDLVFFANTFDRDADGRADDWFTMAAVVESVDDGDIVFIGVFQGEVRRMHMNLSRPSAADDGSGELLNSALRDRTLSDRPFTKYLAGELFAEFGRLAD